MANYKTMVNEIIARCRRVGWGVETSAEGSRVDWVWKISPPQPHRPVYIHRTPSDPRWSNWVLNDLNRAGLTEAEEAWQAQEAARRAEKLEADRRKTQERTDAMARRSKALAAAAGPLAGPQEVDLAWLTTPHELPETRRVIMTPEAAKVLLETLNVANRKRSDARVEYFMELIESGGYRPTHQGGAQDTEGKVQDGQSRLEAIERTGVAVEIQWSVGMPVDNFPALDCGGPRTTRDIAFIMGEADPAATSAAAKVLAIVDRWGPDAYVRSKTKLPHSRVAQAIGEYGDELREAVIWAKEIRKDVRRASPAGLSAGIFMLRRKMPKGDPRIVRFLDDLRYGLDGRKAAKDPVHLLRRMLFAGPSDSRRHYDQFEQLALLIKAWNFRVSGQQKVNLVWRRDNPFPDTIVLPPPIDDDDVFRALVEGSS